MVLRRDSTAREYYFPMEATTISALGFFCVHQEIDIACIIIVVVVAVVVVVVAVIVVIMVVDVVLPVLDILLSPPVILVCARINRPVICELASDLYGELSQFSFSNGRREDRQGVVECSDVEKEEEYNQTGVERETWRKKKVHQIPVRSNTHGRGCAIEKLDSYVVFYVTSPLREITGVATLCLRAAFGSVN